MGSKIERETKVLEDNGNFVQIQGMNACSFLFSSFGSLKVLGWIIGND